MDIAIVSPSPKPFAVGGIEKLMLGMYSKIDEYTDHRVELFKVPTQENDFWNLLNSYETFYRLDLNHFDMVISCKYPAWMVQHKNHVIYMAHHLRGLFDTYHFLKMPETVKMSSFTKINELLEYIINPASLTKDLEYFFELIHFLKANQNSFPQEYFAFPAPFIRKIIHFLDQWALHPSRISKYTAISKTVANRKDYFPKKVDVEVIYPPTSLTNLHEGDYKYFLVVGRLDGPKRVGMIIEAMKYMNSDVDLLIAGSGPEEVKLKSLAQGDSRIKFIGYINNQKLVDLYADALGVIYVPYDEDYGLVTIEAMHCRKPVITCKDSGGTTEFVIHGETGLLADSTPQSLGKQMNKLAADKDYAIKLGSRAKEHIKSVNWENCIQNLFSSDTVRLSYPREKRKKITVLSTYPVFPRKHGGQLRIFNLYKNLDNEYDVTIVSLTKEGNGFNKSKDRFNEICIPMSREHIEKEWELEKDIGIPITDVVMQHLSHLTPEFHKTAKEQMINSDIVIAAQPYLFHLLKEYVGTKKVIYDSQNVEYDLKMSMFPQNKASRKLLKDLFSLEKEACQLSDMIFACSQDDIDKLKDLYDIDDAKLVLVPNGVDVENNPYVSFEEKHQRKAELGLENEKIIVFIGSWHKPNLEAVEEILKFAPQLPEYKFIIMGGQCQAFKDRLAPSNVVFAGMVDENMKKFIYSIADVAINPMVTGSGTNLKIAEYMANGVPVVSTTIGVRGYNLIDKEHVIICGIEDFTDKLRELLTNDVLLNSISEKSRKYIERFFSWNSISSNLMEKL